MNYRPCERCQWHVYIEEHPCMLNAFSTLFCEKNDFCYFEQRIVEEECIECHTVEE